MFSWRSVSIFSFGKSQNRRSWGIPNPCRRKIQKIDHGARCQKWFPAFLGLSDFLPGAGYTNVKGKYFLFLFAFQFVVLA
jgi:hypothetical protein